MSDTVEDQVNTAVTEATAQHDPAALINKLANVQDPIVMNTDATFSFKGVTKPSVDETGQPKTDDLGNPVTEKVKRATVKLQVPVPTFAGIVEALGDEKQQAFILEILKDRIVAAAREQVDNEETPVNLQSEFDPTKVTLAYLAALPPSERRGGGIAKELWEEFSQDYISVIVQHGNRTADKAGAAAKLLLGRLQQCKTDKKVLNFLQGQLDIWVANTQRGAEFEDIIAFLSEKIKTFLTSGEDALLARLA